MASAGRSAAAMQTSPIAIAAIIPAVARCPGRMRLPVAAKALSRRADKAIGSALRCGLDLRNETTGASKLEAVLPMVLSRDSRFTLRRSERSVRKSTPPNRTVVSRAVSRIGSNNSGLPPDAKHLEEVPFEAEPPGPHDKIGAHPHRFEAALDGAVEPLAAILKTEDLSGGD